MNKLRAGRPKRPARFLLAVIFAVATPLAALSPVEARTVAYAAPGQSIADFYAARGDRPLWFGPSMGDQSAGLALIRLLRTARADGLSPDQYPIPMLELALQDAFSGSRSDVIRADRMLSEALLAYVRDLRRLPVSDMLWVDSSLKPAPPSARALLDAMADAESQEAFISGMRWMNPLYAGLRQALARGDALTPGEEAVLRLNLERARALPEASGRYIIVNAAEATLSAYEGPRMVDSMRVVVGKPVNATPMMAAIIRYTSLNPYWNVPPDLTAERVAPNVLRDGLGYLKAKGYQLLSSWDEDATVVDPSTVDWKAVAERRLDIRVRQLPGPNNAMGQMKIMFPNSAGVYLHDTPQKELLNEASRMFSGGCVRLEDAPRLAAWLHREPLQPSGAGTEQQIPLEETVPVFITYLTAVPDNGRIAFYPDVYARDEKALAQLGFDNGLANLNRP